MIGVIYIVIVVTRADQRNRSKIVQLGNQE
jgi:hypothetical protein